MIIWCGISERLLFSVHFLLPPGTWVCQEGATVIHFSKFPWAQREPDNNSGGTPEDCAALSVRKDPSGKWNDVPCDSPGIILLDAVCKRPVPMLHL